MSQWTPKLNEYLIKTKISKKQLAEQLGVSINTLQKWWGNREPSPEYTEKIKVLLSVGVDNTNDASMDVTTNVVVVDEQDQGTERERFKDKSVIISLLRTTCPFCESVIERFRNCPSCGQHFVWVNVPIKD